MLPVLADSVGYLDQPRPVFGELDQIDGAEKLDAIGRRVPQRLQQARGNQDGNIMRLTIQHPGGLLGREAGRQLSMEGQKPMLIFTHNCRSKVEAESLGRHGDVSTGAAWRRSWHGWNSAAGPRARRAGNLLRSLYPIKNLLGGHLGGGIVNQALNQR
jgi:hypothetical protein